MNEYGLTVVTGMAGDVEIVHGLGFILLNGFEYSLTIVFLELFHGLAIFERFFEIGAGLFSGGFSGIDHRLLGLDGQIEGSQVTVVMLDFVYVQHTFEHLSKLSGKTNPLFAQGIEALHFHAPGTLCIRKMTLPIFYNALAVIEYGLKAKV